MTLASAKMIGYVVKTFPKISETFILQEILDLEQQGLDLRIFALQRPTDKDTHSSCSSVRATVEYFPSEPRPSQPYHFTEYAQANWLCRRVRQCGIHHLHAHFASDATRAAELVHLLSGIPFSFTAHAKDIYLSSPADLRRKIHRAQFVFTCTDDHRRRLQQLAPMHRHISHVYHGLDLMKFHARPRRPPSHSTAAPMILSVGRFREKKGFPVLIDACQTMKRHGRPFQCAIIGYGPLRTHLAQRIANAQLDDRVQLVDTMTHDRLIEWYRTASLFVLPCQIGHDGDRDGIPNVLVEAMAMGLPVVSTTLPNIQELIDHERNGVLVPPKSPAALASAMGQILDNPTLAQRFGAQARKRVARDFSSIHNSASIYTAFAKALESSCEKHDVSQPPVAEFMV